MNPDDEETGTANSKCPESAEPGRVIRAHGLFFEVDLTERQGTLLATPRGSLKRGRPKTDIVAVGDRVLVVDVGEGEGRIEAVLPRSRVLARPARKSSSRQQVIVANLDQVLLMFSCSHPEPHLRMLDRFLILAEQEQLPVIVGVNKIDLANEATGRNPSPHEVFGQYAPIYPVHYMSVKTGDGVEELRTVLTGKVTAIAGPSGVGKSSLLNRLEANDQHPVGEISTATGKGRHTTIGTSLRKIDSHSYVADTPGMRALALDGIKLSELERYFPEMRPHLGICQFANCSHLGEPGCAVVQAVQEGLVSLGRYESFAALKRGAKDSF